MVALVLVVGGVTLLLPGSSDRSAPPANQSPTVTSTSTPAPPSSAALLTVDQITGALGGCCGTVHATQPSTGASRCLSSALTIVSSPVPSRSVAVAGDAGLVVTETDYAADPAAVTELLAGVYAACLGTSGNHPTFDQSAAHVAGGHLVGVTFASGGSDGIAQEYAGWAPAGTGAVLVQIAFTGNGDLGAGQVEKLLAAAVQEAAGTESSPSPVTGSELPGAGSEIEAGRTTDSGYFLSATTVGGVTHITFDRAQLLVGKAANDYAKAHHMETPVPNDYLLVNVNPQTRDLVLGPAVTVTGTTILASRSEPVPVSVQTLLAALPAHGTQMPLDVKYDSRGFVVSVSERFFP